MSDASHPGTIMALEEKGERGGSPSIIALSPGKEREIIASTCLPACLHRERSQQFEVTDRCDQVLFFVFF